MASRARTNEAGRCARHPSRADRLPDRASRYFWHGPLDRKLVDVPDADVALDHRMEYLAEQRELALVHLFYKLRHSYGDLRLLHEAPGHLFLEHEAEDLASFLQIAMLNGWGGYILTHADYVNAFFSHDEYIDFFAKLDSNLLEVRKELGIGRSDRIRVPPDARPQ